MNNANKIKDLQAHWNLWFFKIDFILFYLYLFLDEIMKINIW